MWRQTGVLQLNTGTNYVFYLAHIDLTYADFMKLRFKVIKQQRDIACRSDFSEGWCCPDFG